MRRSSSEVNSLLQTLRENLRRMEQAGQPADAQRLSTGCQALDRLLPGGGLGRGTLVEWLAVERGGGAGTLALIAACQAARDGRAIVVHDLGQTFYPPAAAALGIPLEQMLVIRARGEREQCWAWDQTLRCPGVAAVWGQVPHLDTRWFRRWQLAAETSGTIGFLLRPAGLRGQPSWADVQLLVQPLPSQTVRRWRIEVTRCRGGRGGGVVEVELDEVTAVLHKADRTHETHALPLAAELAAAANHRRSARA